MRKLILYALSGVLLIGFLRAFSLEFDTRALLNDAHGLLGCIGRGQFAGCHEAGQFALLQKIPATLLAAIHLPRRWILRLLAYLSLGCFVSVLIMGYREFRSRQGMSFGWAWIWLLLVGPLPLYARSSFSEMLAAWATVGLTLSCLRPARPAWTFCWMLAAGLSKDTAVPFLLLIAAATRLIETDGKRWLPRLEVWLGGLSAVALQIGFNYFRYSGPLSLAYLNPIEQVHSVPQMLSNFAGVWLSPNGGVLFFWPAWGVAVGICAYAAVLKRRWKEVVLILAVLGGLTLGFSRWYAPLGWVSWGPRLILPWLPALLLLMLISARDVPIRVLKRWSVPLLIASFPQFFAIFQPSIKDWIFQHPELCPPNSRIDLSAETYYHCMNSLLWPVHGNWTLLRAFAFWEHPIAFGAALLWALLLDRLWQAQVLGQTRRKRHWNFNGLGRAITSRISG